MMMSKPRIQSHCCYESRQRPGRVILVHCTVAIWLWLAFVGDLRLDIVEAARQRVTSFPTVSSPYFPFAIPTTWPSETPSLQPSLIPSLSQSSLEPTGSVFPSYVASAAPSFSMVPSWIPPTAKAATSTAPSLSKVPSWLPTELPTLPPTASQAPSLPPQPSLSSMMPSMTRFQGVMLPPIELHLILSSWWSNLTSAHDSNQVPLQQIQDELSDFLDTFLGTSINREYYQSLQLKNTKQEAMNTGKNNETYSLSLGLNGTVYYKAGNAPTEQQLEGVLTTYFSFWGIQQLEDRFNRTGLTISDMQVKINGKSIAGYEPTSYSVSPAVAPIASNQTGAGSSSSNTSSSSSTSSSTAVSAAIIAAVLAGFLVLTAAMGVWVIGRRKRPSAAVQNTSTVWRASPPPTPQHAHEQRRLHQNQPPSSHLVAQQRSSSAKLTPPMPQYAELESDAGGDEDDVIIGRPDDWHTDDDAASGIVSIEDSLFTDGSLVHGPPVAASRYDAQRLEQVISSAKSGASKSG